MKNSLWKLLCVCALSFAACSKDDPAPYIADMNTAFPDPTFRAYVVDHFDTDHDGILSEEEAAAVTTIDVANGWAIPDKQEISSLEGLKYFPNLTELNCYYHKLTALDLSQNPALVTLQCYDNQLTALNVTQNPALVYLDCAGNQLTSLDVTQNPELKTLHCWSNQLMALDVTQNPALTRLICWGNQLTALDVTQHPALVYLDCAGNQLTSLDVTQNPALETLHCQSNQLTSLDLSKTNLGNSTYTDPLDCAPMETLETLYLKAGWSIAGITTDRSTEFIPEQTEIVFVD